MDQTKTSSGPAIQRFQRGRPVDKACMSSSLGVCGQADGKRLKAFPIACPHACTL